MSILQGLLWLCVLSRLHGEDQPQAWTGSQTVEAGGLSASVGCGLRLPRPDAPLPIVISVRSGGQQLHTGQLIVTVLESDQPLLTWHSPDWTVSNAGRTQEVLLPPLHIRESHQELNVHLQWLDAETTSDFPPLRLTTNGSDNRPLVLALCASVGTDRKSLIAAASLSKVLGRIKTPDWQPDAFPVTESLAVDRLPSDPLAWCAYEVVVLGGAAIAQLTPHQESALLTWVKGGGSLAIFPDTAATSAVDAFLAQAGLAAHAEVDQSSPQPRLEHLGLGRLALQPIADLANWDPEDQRTALFLWKIRTEWQRDLQAGNFAAEKLAREPNYNYQPYNRNISQGRTMADGKMMPSFMRSYDRQVTAEMEAALLPSDVGLLPFSLIAVIILIFACAIGPGDWIVLGRFKARRFTWVLFPVLSLVTTIALMVLANHYLGSQDRRLRLSIVDEGDQGAVLRCDTTESVFTGRAGQAMSHVHQALWTPVESQNYNFRRRPSGDEEALASIPSYSGTLTSDYTASKDVAQWSPSLRRSLSFSDPGDVPLSLPDGVRAGQLLPVVADLSKRTPGVYVEYFHGVDTHELCGSLKDLFDQTSGDDNQSVYLTGQLLNALCLPQQESWFTFASQVSPCGGDSFDDVPIYDTSDPTHWLLVAAVRRDSTIYVVRRLYQSDAKENFP